MISSQARDFFNSPRNVFIIWALLTVFLNIASQSRHQPSHLVYSQSWPPSDVMQQNIDEEKRVAVTITTIDEIVLADNFLASLERFNVNNFVVIPLDFESYEILSQAYPNHVLPPMPTNAYAPTSNKYSVDRSSFQSIVTSRPNILHAMLRSGYSIFYSDADSVWRTNVFEEVDRSFQTIHQDRQIQADIFLTDDTRPDNQRQYSAGHMYLRPSITTLSFLESWFQQKNNMLIGDYRQSLNTLIKRTEVKSDLQNISLRCNGKEMNALIGDKMKFPTGWMYFGAIFEKAFMTDSQKAEVAIVHNNFESKGTNTKIQKFLIEGLWNPSGRLPTKL